VDYKILIGALAGAFAISDMIKGEKNNGKIIIGAIAGAFAIETLITQIKINEKKPIHTKKFLKRND